MSELRSFVYGVAAIAASVLLIGTPALAQTPTPPPQTAPTPTPQIEDDRRILQGDRTISGGNFTLESNQTLRGDLTLFGGNITLEENSRVEGDVAVFGGNADIAGTVTGDVQVVGGNVDLQPSANVQGDIVRVGGTVNRDPGAVVGGRETSVNIPFLSGLRAEPELQSRVVVRDRDSGPLGWLFGVMASTFFAIAGIVLITIIALAVVGLFPAHVAQATAVALENWLLSIGIGLLTIFAVSIIATVLAVTICLIPVALLLLLALAIGILAGWAITARIVGERVMQAFNRRDWSLLTQTLAGALLLALLGNVPLIGWLVGLAATSLGLGALVLTRAGTQAYPAMAMQPATAMATMPLPVTTPEPYVPSGEPPITPQPPMPPTDEPSA